MTARPTVTVGMPVYGRPGPLRTALARVRAQTYRELRIVVSDNCSPTNDIREVVEAAAAEDPRVEYRRRPANIGIWGNFRGVFTETTGDYFVWAADDDLWEPEFVEACMAPHLADPSVGLAFTRFERIDILGRNDREVIDMTGYNGSPGLRSLWRVFSEPESYGRVNALYGVWKRPLLQELVALPMRWDYPGVDAQFVVAAMLRAGFHADPRILFRKRGEKHTDGPEVRFVPIDYQHPRPEYFARLLRDPDALHGYLVALRGTRWLFPGLLLMGLRMLREVGWEMRRTAATVAKRLGFRRVS